MGERMEGRKKGDEESGGKSGAKAAIISDLS